MEVSSGLIKEVWSTLLNLSTSQCMQLHLQGDLDRALVRFFLISVTLRQTALDKRLCN